MPTTSLYAISIRSPVRLVGDISERVQRQREARECRDRERPGYKPFLRNALIALSVIGISFIIPLAQPTYIHTKTPIAYIDF